MYKSASDKSHPKAIHVSDRFHILKNLTEYAKDALKRLLKKQINITEETATETISKVQKKSMKRLLQCFQKQVKYMK